jgi:hypothetical protein
VYDFVLGMDRWALRDAAYASLMTERYPPFRMDMGGSDPGWVPGGPTAPVPSGTSAAPIPAAPAAAPGSTAYSAAAYPPPYQPAYPPPAPPGRWAAGRVVAVVIGAVLLLTSPGLLLTGGGLLWADQTQRDGAFVMSPSNDVSTSGYALTSDAIVLNTGGADWIIDNFIGRARLEASAVDSGTALFLGVARSRDAAAYLGDVDHSRVHDLGPGWGMGPGMMTEVHGGAPAAPPGDRDIWVAQTSGTGTQVLDWRPQNGDWTVVVMRADGRAGVDVDMRVGATAPRLPWVAGGLLAAGALFALIGALLVALGVHRAQHGPAAGGRPQPPGGPVPPVQDPMLSTGNRS